MIIESQDEKKHPQFVIKDSHGTSATRSRCRSTRSSMVEDGQKVAPGRHARQDPARATTKTKDITGGLPRVVELFEARHPKEPAVITEIDGVVKYGEIVKGERNIYIIPRRRRAGASTRCRSGVHVNVQEGENACAPASALIDGPSRPARHPARAGREGAAARTWSTRSRRSTACRASTINDKHIEVIVRQMMRWVKIEEVGDTEFIVDEQVDKFRFQEENERVMTRRRQPARGRPLLLGITQGVALDRLVHLGRLVPGDDARPHRGVDQRARSTTCAA